MRLGIWFLSLFPAKWLEKALYKKPTIAIVSIIEATDFELLMYHRTKPPPGIKAYEVH